MLYWYFCIIVLHVPIKITLHYSSFVRLFVCWARSFVGWVRSFVLASKIENERMPSDRGLPRVKQFIALLNRIIFHKTVIKFSLNLDK